MKTLPICLLLLDHEKKFTFLYGWAQKSSTKYATICLAQLRKGSSHNLPFSQFEASFWLCKQRHLSVSLSFSLSLSLVKTQNNINKMV